jgi:hypothetical protein
MLRTYLYFSLLKLSLIYLTQTKIGDLMYTKNKNKEKLSMHSKTNYARY